MNSEPGLMRRLIRVAALLAAMVFLMLFLEWSRVDTRSVFWHAAWNFGHVPLFGVTAILILRAVHLSAGRRLGEIPAYAAALIGAVILGALSEYHQISTSRDADLMDWVNDIAGAAAFLAFYYSIDPRIQDGGKRGRSRARVPIRVAAALIILGAAIPVITGGAASWQRRSSFPDMYTFGSTLEKKFIRSSHAEFEFIESPDEWSGHDSRVARITFLPAEYPGLAFNGPYPDWRGHRTLRLDVFSPADSAVAVHLMIKDNDMSAYDDRYNSVWRIDPGLNNIKIAVDEIENSPKRRRLDLSSIRAVHLFIVGPRRPLVLYIDDLVLE